MALINGMAMREYHALKALSASGVFALTEECPARFWADSPWNPDFAPETATHFDVGVALHFAVLEPELFAERVVEVGTTDYRTQVAQAIRDQAYENGKTPLRTQDFQLVRDMHAALSRRPDMREMIFMSGGTTEATLTWDWLGVPCKARPDWMATDGSLILDLKTAESCNPRAISRKAATEGWAVRAAWYIEGSIQALSPMRPAITPASFSSRYRFVVVEKPEPHLIEIFELSERALEWGRRIVRSGLTLFKLCMESNFWPGYNRSDSSGVIMIDLPEWVEHQLADREALGEL